MADYKQLKDAHGQVAKEVIRVHDGLIIPNDPLNEDRAEYDEWLKAGNEPDPPS